MDAGRRRDGPDGRGQAAFRTAFKASSKNEIAVEERRLGFDLDPIDGHGVLRDLDLVPRLSIFGFAAGDLQVGEHHTGIALPQVGPLPAIGIDQPEVRQIGPQRRQVGWPER